MAVLLLVAAFLLAVVALVFTSGVTAGPALVGIACLIGIAARMAQAKAYHRELHPLPKFIPEPGKRYETP